MKKLNYSFLSSKFFDWVMLNGKWSKWHSNVNEKLNLNFLFSPIQDNLFKNSRKRTKEKERRKNQIKEKGNRKFDVLRFKADYESLFTKNLLSSSVHVGTNG